MKKLLVLLLLITTFNVAAQKSVLLRANYNTGDKYLVNVDQSQNMGAQGGLDMKIVMDMSILNKEQDTLTAQTKIKSIVMNMLQGGQVMSFDSSTKDEDLDEIGKMMKQQFAPMMQANIITKMNTRGETLNVDVQPMTPGMEQFTKQSGSIKYPKEKISVGYSWTEDDTQNGMKITTVYTVSKIENGNVYLDVTGTVSGLGTGTVKGNTVIDIKTGMQSKANVEIVIDMNGSEMKISTKSTTTKI